MNIALTEKALINNNLVLANSYIEKLPNNSEELKKLQAEIQNQQTIRETIGYLDKASKLECNIVSKESK